jgi:hypothetical protein
MDEERRLVWRVLRHWKEIADGGRFPCRDEIATLNGIDILHRSILLPLSEDGVAIDHVLGAVSYHSLPTGEALISQVISQTHWF